MSPFCPSQCLKRPLITEIFTCCHIVFNPYDRSKLRSLENAGIVQISPSPTTHSHPPNSQFRDCPSKVFLTRTTTTTKAAKEKRKTTRSRKKQIGFQRRNQPRRLYQGVSEQTNKKEKAAKETDKAKQKTNKQTKQQQQHNNNNTGTHSCTHARMHAYEHTH